MRRFSFTVYVYQFFLIGYLSPNCGWANGSDRNALSSFREQYPEPISVSPTGKHILLKSRHENDFELSIYDVEKKSVTSVHRSVYTQLSLTWSPDGKMVIFQLQINPKLYEFHLLTLEGLKVQKLNAPSSSTALPPLFWAPDSKRIAYISMHQNAPSLSVREMSGALFRHVLVNELSLDASLAWSLDSKEILVCPHKGSKSLLRVNLSTDSRENYALPPGSLTKQVFWPEVDTAFLVTRSQGKDFFELKELSLAKKRLNVMASENGDISSPFSLNSNSRIGFHVSLEGMRFVKILDISRSVTSKPLNQDDSSFETQAIVSSGEKLIGLSQRKNGPPSIVAIEAASGAPTTIFATPSYDKLRIAPAQSIDIGVGEKRFFGFLWESQRSSSTKNVLIMVHGGPELQEKPFWTGEIRELLASGWNVLAVNYRGSSGYGAQFSKVRPIEDHIEDFSESIKFIRQKYSKGVKIFAIGSSYGSRIVFQSLSSVGSLLSAVFLQSMIVEDHKPIRKKSVSTIVHGFHGAEDPMTSPGSAQAFLENELGKTAFHWTVFPREGHHFHRTSSRRSVLNAILRAGQ